MQQAYADFDLTILNELLDLVGAKVIGGQPIDDQRIRLHLMLDNAVSPDDVDCEHLDFTAFLKALDIRKRYE